ncbi:MAG TPA: tetratricopeptide repeat protein [Bacteroidales bacterium]
MKKQIIIGFILTILIHTINGQPTLKQQFDELVKNKDTTGQKNLLIKWENSNHNDPELYVAYFNYFVNKSRKEVIRIDKNPNGDKVLSIMDKDSSKKEPVGYLYGDTYYEPEFLKKGFSYIDIGISKYPSRLDMRFGKTYMYGQLQDYENFTNEIIKTIDYSNTIHNQWTWSENKPVDNPMNFMLSAIQDYQYQLYNTGDNRLLPDMKRIAEKVLTYYPNHVESLSNLAVVYLLNNEYDKALVPLLKAEKLAPQDYIVLSNIAQSYKLKGDKNNAIKYYEKVVICGDDQAKEYAKQQINELKK